jgi:hypothetical protein
MKTLEKDPAARYQHMSEVEAELGAINPEALINVTKVPAVGRAGGTGRSKLRSNRSLAPKAGDGAFQITSPGLAPEEELAPPSSKKKMIGIGVGVLAVAGVAVAVLGGGKKEAPAPAAAPVAAQKPAEPAAPAAVKIEITSTPPGASVVRAEDGAFLGRTPYRAPFPKSTKELALIVRHEGFEDQKVVVPLLEDGKAEVALKAVAAPVEAKAAPEPKAASHGRSSGGGKSKGGGPGDGKNDGKNDGKSDGKKKRGWGDLVDF